MAAGAAKSVAFGLLILNFIMYVIISIIAGWALNHGIEHTPQTVSQVTVPAHLFPIYFPIGNMATPFFIVFSLIAGLVGMATSVAGINNILQWNASNLLEAASSSLVAWALTLLALGLACKEINTSERDGNLLFCTGAIHAGIPDASYRTRSLPGRV